MPVTVTGTAAVLKYAVANTSPVTVVTTVVAVPPKSSFHPANVKPADGVAVIAICEPKS